MNEQELADFFSTQIDRLLGGEPAVDLAINGDLPLLALGQQLTEISFQPSPAAQAAFQGQLASWFGPTGGGLSTITLGGPKIILISLGVALTVISAGLGVVVLISFMWTGALFNASDESRPEPGVLPVMASPEATPSPTSLPTATRPRSTTSLKDVLPRLTISVGDTILRPTATLTSTAVAPEGTATPNDAQASDGDDAGNGDSSGDTTPEGDHDRGHGNDLDGYDEDNLGQSDGVSGGNSQNDGSGGISPGDLSGGGGSGGNSGGGNAGGEDHSNDGNNGSGNSGGNGGGQDGGKKGQ